jgi:hypothetical protein
MTTGLSGGVKTFLLDNAQVKHLTSIFVPSPKTDVRNCTNNFTTAPFPHGNKNFLRIIKNNLSRT